MGASEAYGVQGTSHRPVTGQICPLLAADRTSRATCSGEAGTEKNLQGRLSGGRNSDRTNPDQPRLDQLCPPVPRPKRNGRSGPSGAPSSRSSSQAVGRVAKTVAGRAPKSSQAARQKGCRAPSGHPEGVRPNRAQRSRRLVKNISRFFRFDRKSQRPCPVLGRTKFQPMSGQAGIPTVGLKFPGAHPCDGQLGHGHAAAADLRGRTA